MGIRMFDAARAIVLASLPSGLSPEETRRRLFERMYADLAEEDVPAELRPDAVRGVEFLGSEKL